MLLVPMQDMQGDVIGVLQLLNARSVTDGVIIDFPEEAVAMTLFTSIADHAIHLLPIISGNVGSW